MKSLENMQLPGPISDLIISYRRLPGRDSFCCNYYRLHVNVTGSVLLTESVEAHTLPQYHSSIAIRSDELQYFEKFR